MSTDTTATKTQVEVFEELDKKGVKKIEMEFYAGWDYAEIHSFTCWDKNDAEIDDDDLDDLHDFIVEDVESIAHDKARTLGYGYDEYDRYAPGEYYQGTYDDDDYGKIIFDIPARKIRMEAQAKVKVVTYRVDDYEKIWDLDVKFGTDCIVKTDRPDTSETKSRSRNRGAISSPSTLLTQGMGLLCRGSAGVVEPADRSSTPWVV
jgi:hypothetical protein